MNEKICIIEIAAAWIMKKMPTYNAWDCIKNSAKKIKYPIPFAAMLSI